MADSPVDQMAAKLADECLAVQNEIGNDRLFMEVAQVLGASSQTLEEAFLTAIRIRMADAAGRQFLNDRLQQHRAQQGSDASDPS